MGIAQRYISKIHRETSFFATWTPSQVLSLGDFGTLDSNGAFQLEGKLSKLGFTGLSSVSEARSDDFLEITTESGTSITVKAAGDTMASSKLPQAKAGLSISFTKADALVCKLKGPTQESVDNLKDIEDFVIEQYKAGKWTKEWRIVTQRVFAAGTTIVYSDTQGVAIEATAEAPIQNIADANIGLSIVHKSGGAVNVVGGANLSPFITLVRLHKPLFGTPGLKSFTRDMVVSGEVAPVLVVDSPRSLAGARDE